MAQDYAGPTKFIHPDPSPNTPHFGGVPIRMKDLADTKGYDYSYLSKIFSGDRMPGPAFATRLSRDLGMTLPDFYGCCQLAAARDRN